MKSASEKEYFSDQIWKQYVKFDNKGKVIPIGPLELIIPRPNPLPPLPYWLLMFNPADYPPEYSSYH